MKTYAKILDKMNLKVNQLADEVKQLENNYTNTDELIKYLLAYNKHYEVINIYHKFFSYCIRNGFDLNSEFIDTSL